MTIDEIALGQDAKRVLDSDAFQQAVLRSEHLLISQWEEAQSTGEREQLWAQLKGLKLVVRQLRAIFDDGVIADARSDTDETP